MIKVKNKVIISDVTLRDGNHAVNHSINEKVIRSYCELIDETGVNIVEVGHGNGLGASSLSIGRSNISDEKALKIARSELKKTKLYVKRLVNLTRIACRELSLKRQVQVVLFQVRGGGLSLLDRNILLWL